MSTTNYQSMAKQCLQLCPKGLHRDISWWQHYR